MSESQKYILHFISFNSCVYNWYVIYFWNTQNPLWQRENQLNCTFALWNHSSKTFKVVLEQLPVCLKSSTCGKEHVILQILVQVNIIEDPYTRQLWLMKVFKLCQVRHKDKIHDKNYFESSMCLLCLLSGYFLI